MERLRDMQEGYRIVVGKTSITIKDQNDKTRGVIRNINTWDNLQFNKKVDWNIKFNEMGLDIRKICKNLVFKDNKVYYLFNKRIYNMHKEWIEKLEGKEGYDLTSSYETIKRMNDEVELCNKYNIEVLAVNM